MKPLDEWNEEYIANLPAGEDDRFDRKHSQVLIDCCTGQGSDKKRIDLSCDVSSFANSGGGFLIYGVSNAGTIDGGVPTRMKAGGTYDWLDALIGDSVEPVLRGYRIKEITAANPTSQINADHAIYVVSVPDSENAPHQARDRKYYLRVNAHNCPATHRQIEDIRGRRLNPTVEGYIEFKVSDISHDEDRGVVSAELRPVCHLSNSGRVTARDLSLVFTFPEFSEVRYLPGGNLIRNCDTDAHQGRLYFYLNSSLHPGQTFSLHLGETILVFEYRTFLENKTKRRISGISFPSTLYMQDAPPISIDGSLASDRVSRDLRRELANKFDWADKDEGTYR